MESEIGKSYVTSIGKILQKLNNKVNNDKKFDALKVPSISITNYLERYKLQQSKLLYRLEKYLYCSYESFIIALIYIDRIIDRYDFVITSMNAHRLILACMRLATKFHDEDTYDNKYVSQVGGVKVHELNRLEIEALFFLSFNLFVDNEEYEKYYESLGKNCVLKKQSSSISINSVLTTLSKERVYSGIVSDEDADIEVNDEN